LIYAKWEDQLPVWLQPNAATDSQLANIGQLKTVFNFNLTAPTGQLPEWWQKFYFNGQTGIDPNGVAPDGTTYITHYSNGTNPTEDDDHPGGVGGGGEDGGGGDGNSNDEIVDSSPENVSANPDTRQAPAPVSAVDSIRLAQEEIRYQRPKPGFGGFILPEGLKQERYLVKTMVETSKKDDDSGRRETVTTINQLTGKSTTAINGNVLTTGPYTWRDTQASETTYDYQERGKNWEYTQHIELSRLYSDEEFRQDTFANAWRFKGYYEVKNTMRATAHLLGYEPEHNRILYAKNRYKLLIPDSFPKPYRAIWYEIFSPYNQYSSERPPLHRSCIVRSEYIMGSESKAYIMDPAAHPGMSGTWATDFSAPSIRGIDQKDEYLYFAAGVDNTSMAAKAGDLGYQNKPWIMAPIGSTNPVWFSTAAREDLHISLTCSTANPTSTILKEGSLEVIWSGLGNQTIDGEVKLQGVGIAGVKTMKRREIDVYVHPIASAIPGKPIKDPYNVPTEAQLQAYLDRVFEKQLNVKLQVHIKPVRAVNWDIAGPDSYPGTFAIPAQASQPGDGVLDVKGPSNTPEQLAILNSDSYEEGIQVFLVGGTPFRHISQGDPVMVGLERLAGIADTYKGSNDVQMVWVNSDRIRAGADAESSNQLSVAGVMNTTAHEIGHLIIGPDHPDEGAGPAPLDNSDPTVHAYRLMCSGANRNRDYGIQLLKAEWDNAEELLRINFDPNNQ